MALDTDRISIATDQEPGQEFLEGLDARDPEFEAWLARERQARTGATGAVVPNAVLLDPARATLCILSSGDPGDPLRLLEDLFADATARTVDESLPIRVVRTPPSPAPPGLLIATVQAIALGDGSSMLRVALDAVEGHRMIWSEICQVPLRGALDINTPEFLGLSNRLVAAVAGALRTPASPIVDDLDAAMEALLAVDDIFSIEPARLDRARTRLEQAIEIDPRGVYHGWLAQLRVIQAVERFVDQDSIVSEARFHCARALELEPCNSTVLATAASTRLILEQDIAVSGELARAAVQANPANPFARATLSIAQLYYGRIEEAQASAKRAQILAAGSRLRFWAEFELALTSAL
ncbi:MAG: hypothetical protein AAF390_06065, partial [Pseudomonadota bacterium]